MDNKQAASPPTKKPLRKILDTKEKYSGLFSELKDFLKKSIQNLYKELFTIRQKLKDVALTNYKLGIFHYKKGNMRDAILRFKITCWLTPERFPEAYYYLGCIKYLTIENENDKKQALSYLQKALTLKSPYPEAQYYLNRLTAPKKITSIPLRIIQESYDDCASGYNEYFTYGLHYQGHHHLLKSVDKLLLNQDKRMIIADIGCGTGFCGIGFKKRGVARWLDGIDISTLMLDEAKKALVNELSVYDGLIRDDFIHYLCAPERKEMYDLISAALVFNYQGDLSAALRACKHALKSGGFLAFSVEKYAGEGYVIDEFVDSFKHSLAYVEAIATQEGFTNPLIIPVTLYDGCEGYQCVLTA